MPSSWINYYQRVSICIDITIYPARQPNRIRLHIPANACAAIPVPVLVQVRFRIKILLRQLQVDLCCRGRVNSGFAESLVVRLPRRLARLVQRQYGRSQVICELASFRLVLPFSSACQMGSVLHRPSPASSSSSFVLACCGWGLNP